MTVRDLIEMLAKAQPDDVVKIFNGDTGQAEPVSGMLYGHDKIVELCSDDPF